METKICSICKVTFPNDTEHFYRTPYGKTGNACKPCHKKRQMDYANLVRVPGDTPSGRPEKTNFAPPPRPTYKRYKNGTLDLILMYRNKNLAKTIDYGTWRRQHPTRHIKTEDTILIEHKEP